MFGDGGAGGIGELVVVMVVVVEVSCWCKDESLLLAEDMGTETVVKRNRKAKLYNECTEKTASRL